LPFARQPLHLIILAVASVNFMENSAVPADFIRIMLNHFPGAVAVANNEGNLPIHLAVGSLHGDIGVDVVYLLLDEAQKQVDAGLCFAHKHTAGELDDSSDDSRQSANLGVMDDLHSSCHLVLNGVNATPLMTAIRARAGWKIIEALVCDPGGSSSVCYKDHERNNALHLLVSESFMDPASVMTVVKVAPEAALFWNDDGMRPIELACMNLLPSEVILALVLVDLPFEVDDVHGTIREDFGGSWFFLVCECDDQYLAVVEEVLFLCSYPQVRALCFYSDNILTRATPKCREAIQRSLRFLGRFEFIGSGPDGSKADGCQIFAAIDYGGDHERRVVLKNYADQDLFHKEVS
jgi:hypothetical protein